GHGRAAARVVAPRVGVEVAGELLLRDLRALLGEGPPLLDGTLGRRADGVGLLARNHALTQQHALEGDERVAGLPALLLGALPGGVRVAHGVAAVAVGARLALSPPR